MKKAILFFMILNLTGCAAVDAYFMTKFDSNEYGIINEIRTLSQYGKNTCDDQIKSTLIADNIYLKSIQFKNYAQYIPDNTKTLKLADSLVLVTEPLYKRYHSEDKVGEAYCKQKLSIIESSSETIEQVLGVKPR